MSGVHGHVLGRIVKRGVDMYTRPGQAYMEQLHDDAQAYEQSGPDMQIHDWEMLPVVVTALLTLLIIGSIKYTFGEVIASLTMIESPTSTAIIDDKPPAYVDEPDAPLEKETLPSDAEADAEADIEVALIPNKPITSKVTTTLTHLKRVGGFRAKWRGAALSIIYHSLHSVVSRFLASLLGFGLIGNALVYIFTSVALARLHMAWTHSMVAYPSAKPFWRRMVSRKQARPILLPAFVFAAAQQATLILPMAVAFAVGLPDIQSEHIILAAQHKNCKMLALMSLRFLAVPATLLFVAFAVLLPATVTLTRIEALLLPEDQETIVPFDRQAIVGDLDITACGSSKKLFVQAWRSFDRAARWRLIKVYVKMAAIQFCVAMTGLHLMVAEVYLIGGERLGVFMKSAVAQIKLEAIDLQEKAAQ